MQMLTCVAACGAPHRLSPDHVLVLCKVHVPGSSQSENPAVRFPCAVGNLHVSCRSAHHLKEGRKDAISASIQKGTFYRVHLTSIVFLVGDMILHALCRVVGAGGLACVVVCMGESVWVVERILPKWTANMASVFLAGVVALGVRDLCVMHKKL